MLRRPLAVLLLRLGAVALVYTLLRILFWLLNMGTFPHPPLNAFLSGTRFDLSAIAWTNLPWALLFLIAPRPGRTWARVQYGVFMTVNAVALFFNCVDLEYYKFSMKRSTADLLSILTAGNDTVNLVPAFVRDYWYIVLIYVGCSVLLAWLYRITRPSDDSISSWPRAIAWRVVAIGTLVLASRGGVQLIPLQPLDAARSAGPTYMPLVLNTPFTILMSLGKPTLVERQYMSPEEAAALWPVVHDMRSTAGPVQPWGTAGTFTPISPAPADPNVVVIILESFSALYSAELAGGEGHMPFLDSLMRASLHFTRAYANGRRSIDGIPAILAGIPELMDEAFITSPYAGRPFTSLANVLGAKGYHTSFYHGGRNGTMGFDGFARSAGFQRYVGLNEYPGPASDHDGHWGIRDRPFLQFYAQELNNEPQPFLSTVFTLSSHHPYELPADDAARFAGGTMPIHPTLRYTDDALRRFFDTVRTMPWYANTIFVITADHTADLERNGVHGDKPIDHWIPLVVHAPGRVLPYKHERVTQQIDILSMVLDLAGYDRPFFSFGHSPLRQEDGYAIMASNGIYHIIGDQARLRFDGEQMLDIVPLNGAAGVDRALAADMEQRLKAAIQQFNHHLLHGSMVIEPSAP
jgi:hypothetical protein